MGTNVRDSGWRGRFRVAFLAILTAGILGANARELFGGGNSLAETRRRGGRRGVEEWSRHR